MFDRGNSGERYREERAREEGSSSSLSRSGHEGQLQRLKGEQISLPRNQALAEILGPREKAADKIYKR